jgi:hypothetical protein
VQVLGSRFRNVFLAYLREAFEDGKLQFHGEMAGLAKPAAFEALCLRAERVKWVVHAKPPFGGPEQVLKYLARYTHRVAISNSRILSIADGKVAFLWKDYADGNKTKTMILDAVEFIRRFLLHILPAGFVRIRQFGFLANRARREKLALCRALLGVLPAPPCPRARRCAGQKSESETVPGLPDRPHDSHPASVHRKSGCAAAQDRFIMMRRLQNCRSTAFAEAGGEARPLRGLPSGSIMASPAAPAFPDSPPPHLPPARPAIRALRTRTASEKYIQSP